MTTAPDGTPPQPATAPGDGQPADKDKNGQGESGGQGRADEEKADKDSSSNLEAVLPPLLAGQRPGVRTAGGAGRGRDAAPPGMLPAPFASPPFPSGEYQGYPLIGVPVEGSDYPLQKAIDSGPRGDTFKDLRINIDGWVNVSANWSNAEQLQRPDLRPVTIRNSPAT